MPKPPPSDLLLALNAAPGLGRAVACRLALNLEHWRGGGSAAGAAGELGVPIEAVERARAVARRAGPLAAEERRAVERAGARPITLVDADYPDRLRHLALPPPVLYLRGELPPGPAVAIVGSRNADPYGREAASLFARALAAAGVAVVSGFARGIDAAAHRGALAGGGPTVAVLGCGVDVVYPKAHRELAAEVAAGGALLSELPCGSQPRPWNFPVRNRIIAALADGTLVVQAAARSGSLITARHALELGREVFALPGRIFDERSLGPNALLRDGALLVQHPKDVLEALPAHARAGLATGAGVGATADDEGDAEPLPTLPGLAGRLLAALPPGRQLSPEELADETGAAVDRVLGGLLELELAGWVRRDPGPRYGRRLC
jgi:DNA processing protein